MDPLLDCGFDRDELLTDEDLKSQREAWPASYRMHARILSAILS